MYYQYRERSVLQFTLQILFMLKAYVKECVNHGILCMVFPSRHSITKHKWTIFLGCITHIILLGTEKMQL